MGSSVVVVWWCQLVGVDVGSRWVRLVVALCACFALVGFGALLVGAAVVPAGRMSDPVRGAGGRGLSALPVAALGPVSAAVGADDPAYRVRGFVAVNGSERLGLHFTRGGAELSSGAEHVRLGLWGFGRGRVLRAVPPVMPRVFGNRVIYRRVSVREWYVNGPLGVEQGFDLPARPSGRGVLMLAVALTGDVRVRADGRGGALLGFAGGSALRYADLSAVDAQGRALRAWLVPRAGRLLIAVDDRDARYPVRIDPFIQQGAKLLGSGSEDGLWQSSSLALSGDGKTALISGYDQDGAGWAWVFVRSGGTWTQQGARLVRKGAQNTALSRDGSTAVIVGLRPNDFAAVAWVFERSGRIWAQEGPELVVTGAVKTLDYGALVALSDDGNTLLIGNPGDNDGLGAAWVFVRSGGTWTQQGPKLVGSGSVGNESQAAAAVALSGDGNTALIGNPGDNDGLGAAWVFVRSG